MMEAVRISETSVNLYEPTWRNIPKGFYVHTLYREKLKSHNAVMNSVFTGTVPLQKT
jgi:hypothetical protein